MKAARHPLAKTQNARLGQAALANENRRAVNPGGSLCFVCRQHKPQHRSKLCQGLFHMRPPIPTDDLFLPPGLTPMF
jgi:hypothetical protein